MIHLISFGRGNVGYHGAHRIPDLAPRPVYVNPRPRPACKSPTSPRGPLRALCVNPRPRLAQRAFAKLSRNNSSTKVSRNFREIFAKVSVHSAETGPNFKKKNDWRLAKSKQHTEAIKKRLWCICKKKNIFKMWVGKWIPRPPQPSPTPCWTNNKIKRSRTYESLISNWYQNLILIWYQFDINWRSYS